MHIYDFYLSIITGSDGVSFRFPQLFLSQHRLKLYFIHFWSMNRKKSQKYLHIISCVNKTRHISGFLSWPSYAIACKNKENEFYKKKDKQKNNEPVSLTNQWVWHKRFDLVEYLNQRKHKIYLNSLPFVHWTAFINYWYFRKKIFPL